MILPRNTVSAVRYIQRMRRKFPETKRSNLLNRINRLQHRRAKNKVARASRRRNRP